MRTAGKPSYRYEFRPDELDAIAACNAEHGFAIVRGLIGDGLVERLKDDVRRVLAPEGLPAGESRLHTSFVEVAPSLLELIAHAPWLRLQERLLGTDDLVLHRSAAIVRAPGSTGAAWHTDMPVPSGAPSCANHVLNCGEWPNGMWFYLTGSHPERGGLAVIEGSHAPDWTPPPGFTLGRDRQSIHRAGEEAWCADMDVPGTVQMVTEPNDVIVFAARTYHAANRHGGGALRLSTGMGLRPRSFPLRVPWALPERARAFVATVPEPLRRYFDGYPGIVDDWKPAAGAAA